MNFPTLLLVYSSHMCWLTELISQWFHSCAATWKDCYRTYWACVWKSIKLGFAVEIRPAALRKKDRVTKIGIERLHKGSTNLYVQLVENFMEQTPLGSIIVCNSKVHNPNALIMVYAGCWEDEQIFFDPLDKFEVFHQAFLIKLWINSQISLGDEGFIKTSFLNSIKKTIV